MAWRDSVPQLNSRHPALNGVNRPTYPTMSYPPNSRTGYGPGRIVPRRAGATNPHPIRVGSAMPTPDPISGSVPEMESVHDVVRRQQEVERLIAEIPDRVQAEHRAAVERTLWGNPWNRSGTHAGAIGAGRVGPLGTMSDSEFSNMLQSALGQNREMNRSHGATMAGHPTGAANPLGSYADNFGDSPSNKVMIGGHPVDRSNINTTPIEDRVQFLMGRYVLPDGANIQSTSSGPFPDGVQQLVNEAAGQMGMRPETFGKYTPGQMIPGGYGYSGVSPVIAGRFVHPEQVAQSQAFETPTGGLGLRSIRSMLPEFRRELDEDRAMRRLAQRYGLPLSLEGESREDSLARLRSGAADYRSRRQLMGEASSQLRAAMRSGNEPLYNAASRRLRDLSRGTTQGDRRRATGGISPGAIDPETGDVRRPDTQHVLAALSPKQASP